MVPQKQGNSETRPIEIDLQASSVYISNEGFIQDPENGVV